VERIDRQQHRMVRAEIIGVYTSTRAAAVSQSKEAAQVEQKKLTARRIFGYQERAGVFKERTARYDSDMAQPGSKI
jgi:hypothetical protein